ncbi:TRAP transporter substrate-binding protein [Oscillibacter sp. 1-3]|uniref:TRAP transporter substrate-binding protein n=1 Tax=Oscillibacter sp. 1-3 TaxID=1235797 RepID=UPI00033AF3A3|nr:TRAP transporter substrate-binding protein [Oscillibacter sp. 1-3]EOS65012.1 DctP family TRAP transporter solute receptor [Oscillibacter sp. 1-3]
MSKKFTKIVALFLILAMLCTGCGLSGAPADSGASDPAAADDPQANTDSGDGSAEVKVGLEQNVYEIPDYTNAGPGVKVLRLSVSMGAGDYGTSASGVMFKTFVDRIEELSGGKMLAQVYPASQLASTTDDIVNGILTGAFEMAEVGTGNWGDYTSAFTPMNTPFLYASDAVCYEVMSGEMGQIMNGQMLADTGIRAEGFMYLGMRTITNNTREIHSPADLRGLKIRVQSDPTQLALFEELGASTMTVSFSELFTALQQKLCDGQDNPIISVVSRKFYEVQNYITMLNHLPNISIFVMSDAYYQSLSAEEQAWVDQAAQDATEACYNTLVETQEILKEQLIAYGINITDLTAEEYQVFTESVPNTTAMCEEAIGAENWSKLMSAIEAAEAKAG